MKIQLTKRQNDLLNVIYQYIKSTGYPPTFEEMREKLGVSSNQTIIDHLTSLKNKGIIKRKESDARGIAILPLGYEALGKPPLAAFLGVTSAGAPLETVEVSGEWQSLSDEIVRLQEEVFLLKINGDSMINAGINDGDIVLVQSVKEFYPREIVLAETSDGSTVKRFMSEDKPPYVWLQPENPKYNNILFDDDVRLTGKVISVMKDGSWRGVK